MTYNLRVKGNITTNVGGTTRIYAKEGVEINSNGSINYYAPEYTYGEPEDPPKREDKICTCIISKKAVNFKTLIELVKQAEEMLIQNGQNDMGTRINTIRGIYYGTLWSMDYRSEQSTNRNSAFTVYTGSTVEFDAREVLKCTENCKSQLFESLIASPEVFENTYKAVDFGHLIIGLDSRRSWRSKNVKILTQGGTGLELNTWVGDLGGGTGTLSKQRITNPKKRAKTIFLDKHSYGAMANLEGDIAAYVVGMDEKNPSEITDCTNNFRTIHEALQDYFYKKWNRRTFYFMAMLGADVSDNVLSYDIDKLLKQIAEKFNDFARWYLGNRMKDKNSGGIEDFAKASNHFKPVSEEIASIFVDGLRHVIKKPEDMITSRTDPEPRSMEESTTSKIYEKGVELIKKTKDIADKLKY
jgi:hypothetical protein